MAVNTKAVKNRINSVKNTKKITKAMQMISAVKMRKATENAVNTRAYATLANDLLTNIGGGTYEHPLMKQRKTQRHLVVLISSNKGLCGSYNMNIIRFAEKLVNHLKKTEQVKMIAIGLKSASFAKRNELELLGIYEKLSENPKYEDILPITKMMTSMFLKKEIDKATIIYTNYISGLVQKPVARQVVPLTKENIIEMIEDLDKKSSESVLGEEYDKDPDLGDYEFEPNKKLVLEYIVPILVEIQVYQAILESAASEHSSRMLAMKNASEAAGDMIDYLTLEYNKGRQAAITREISEIVGGASAIDDLI